MDSKTRLLTAWDHKEPDRVPVEIRINEAARDYEEAQFIFDFVENEADNFRGVPAVNWGFLGLQAEYHEEQLREDETYRWLRRSYSTQVGEFYAITRHRKNELIPADYHWERRYIHDLSDFQRLVEADWTPLDVQADRFRSAAEAVGTRGVPLVGLLHPLGRLVRQATMEEVYQWLLTERSLVHRFLEKTTALLVDMIEKMHAEGVGPYFTVTAHEMLIPPWLGDEHFDEFVRQYDSAVFGAVHKGGGRLRAHCHGRCGAYLERMSAMGIDCLEPLEPEPFGDVDLADAKRRVGDSMLLCGNVPSQLFTTWTPDEVRESVRRCISDAAHGGGFSLRTTGGGACTGSAKSPEQLRKILSNVRAYIEAGLEFGQYPITV